MGSFCGNLVTYGWHAQCWGLLVTLWLHLGKSPSCPSLQLVLPGPVPVVFRAARQPHPFRDHVQAFAVSHLLFASPRFLLSSSQHTHALLKYLWWLLILMGSRPGSMVTSSVQVMCLHLRQPSGISWIPLLSLQQIALFVSNFAPCWSSPLHPLPSPRSSPLTEAHPLFKPSASSRKPFLACCPPRAGPMTFSFSGYPV